MYLFYWSANYKVFWFMSNNHSISSFSPPSCCSDEAVIQKYNIYNNFIHLTATSHRRHFTVILFLLP